MTARILVIDDDPNMRDMLSLCCKAEGWQPFSLRYDEIDLAGTIHLRPDFIILDLSPRQDGRGWELLQSLKMEDITAKIPVLVTTTAFQLPLELREYLFTRYIGVIPKPFDLNSFLMQIHDTLTKASQANTLLKSERTLPILVVDDMEELRDNITFVLNLEGYPFVTASNGLSALETVTRTDHSLILLDIDMPIMNGFEFLTAYDRQLRPHSPVVLLSGSDAIHRQSLQSFVVDVIPKPFELHRLLYTVAQYAQVG